jgi:GBP family porin
MQTNVRISLAIAAMVSVVGAASAQSSVIIAGRVDGSLQYIDNGMVKTKRLDSGTYSASRLSFGGTEDLGGGLSALFYLEHRLSLDTGAAANAAKFWNGGSFVGLSSKTLGTITLGRQYGPTFWTFLLGDESGPVRNHSYSAVTSIQRSNFARIAGGASPIKTAGSLDTLAGGLYSLGITSTYEDNLIVYKSPELSGLTLRLAAGAPEGYQAGSGKIYGTNVEYRNGPLAAALAYNVKEGTVPAGGAGPRQKLQDVVASGMYSVTKDFKVWGNYHPWKLDSAGSQLKGRDWMLGTSYWLPQSQVWVNYARKTMDDCSGCNSSGFGVGYHYLLSKRTELYASYASVSNGANAANTLNGFAPAALGQRVRGLAAGIMHVF